MNNDGASERGKMTGLLSWAMEYKGLVRALPLLVMAPASWAGYGPLALGSAGEDTSMGSAAIARSHNAIGSNTNPAGMTAIDNKNASGYGEWFSTAGLIHTDSLGNDHRSKPAFVNVFGAGYAQRLNEDVVLGLAFIAQGGVGFRYEDLLTEGGNRDELSVEFGVFRIAPAIAWQATDKLSVGISVGLNYSMAEQRVLPNTSIAPSGSDPGFAGISLDGMSGWSGSYRLGLQYALSDTVMLGAAYGGATKLKLQDGEGTVNFEAHGLGRVNYADARMDGLEFAQELGVGVSWDITPEWEWATDVAVLDWSQSMKESRLTLSSPDNANAPQTIAATQALDMRDQYIVSTGVKHRWSEDLDVMAGYSYARNPLPDENLTPLFNIIAEQHFTVGVSRQFSSGWKLLGSFFYIPKVEGEYQNTLLPLGERSKEEESGWDVTITLERNW